MQQCQGQQKLPLRHSASRALVLAVLTGVWLICPGLEINGAPGEPGLRTFSEALSAARARLTAEPAAGSEQRLTASIAALEAQFPREWNWLRQDLGGDVRTWFAPDRPAQLEQQVIATVLEELNSVPPSLRESFAELCRSAPAGGDARWLDLYLRACAARRGQRLRVLLEQSPRVVFTKHYNLGGSHYAYTEGLSDAQHERHFVPGSALCVLEFVQGEPHVRTLLDDPHGVIRDPDVSWDGDRILFAWKKSDRADDYHLYEYAWATGEVRQLTSGLGFADYEGAYLPNSDIIFNSTRCVQTVDCWWTEVSNLYTCGPNGEFLRRLTFDQVHDNYPAVLPDGRVVYTRWEYNDRGQIYVQGLFQMNPDGTGQTEFYGNNSWFPTTLLHARGIPGTQKLVAIFSGHHTIQAGKLGLIDPALGRQENTGAQLIAPVRSTPADRIDAYGQDGELFQYPYPLSETEFLVACAPHGWSRDPALFQLFLVNADGRREFLVADSNLSCNQPVPLRPRVRPPVRPSVVDYRQTNAIVFLQDIFSGPGLAGIRRDAVRKLRVIALGYRAAGIGFNVNAGAAGDALVSTPVAIGNGSWDTKTVLGEAAVHSDGSACFLVPARTPVYFQALDEQGFAVQSMRSWTTFQPGEIASCVGCHEHKNTTPPTESRLSQALAAGPQVLQPFYGPARGFSFTQEIQPILDRHCVRCHDDSTRAMDSLRNGTSPELTESSELATRAFSLRSVPITDESSKRHWTESYLALTHARLREGEGSRSYAGQPHSLVHWIDAQSVPEMLPPYAGGAAKSRLLALLREEHSEVKLSREEMEKLACWIDLAVPFCGDYTEANAWSREETREYQRFAGKRAAMLEIERQNIQALLRHQESAPANPAPPPLVDVFVGGKDGYPAYRIPALIATGGGALLAFAEGRSTLSDHAQNDIVLKRSLDNGQTWGPLQLIHADGANALNNPTAVVVRETRRVLLMYQHYPKGFDEHKAEPGHTGPRICRTFLTHSDDDGLTWSEPADITAQVKRPTEVTSTAAGPGIGIQLLRGPCAGRILMPFNQGPYGRWKVYAVFSDDLGRSWRYGHTAPEAAKGMANEVQFVELNNGSVMLNARNQSGGNLRKVAISTDGGETWSPTQTDATLIEPVCQASLLRHSRSPAAGGDVLLFSNPASQTARTNGTVRLSRDDGRTWPVARVLYPGSFAYSCLASLPDGAIGCLFERDGTTKISFARFGLEWLVPPGE